MIADLSTLTIGQLTLTPTFADSVLAYTAATSNASDTITATAEDTDATVTITVNGTAHTSGESATWDEGANAVVVTVTNGTVQKVYAVTITYTAPNTDLSVLTIGSVTLSPTFNANTIVYTAATTNATNAVTATAEDTGATVAITVNGTAHTSGESATWQTGTNTVVATVTNGTATKVYTVTVTKS